VPIDAPVTSSPLPLQYDRGRPAPRSAAVAIGALVLCCVLWGYSFPVMQVATGAFDRHVLTTSAERGTLASRGLFNGVRFGLAAVLYGVVTARRQRGFQRDEVLGGVVVGAFFGAGMLLQVTGLRWTFPSVSSFLTALAVVFAPVAQAVLFRRPVRGATWLAVALALVGMVLLGWPKPEAAAAANTLAVSPPVPYLGEVCTIVASMLFTGQILAVDRFGQRADAVRLTLVMLATTSLISFAVGAGIGGASLLPGRAAGLIHDREVWWTMGTLVAVCSVMALHLMNTYQPRLSPATASVLYCSEPLFGTIFSLLFATERLTGLTVAGGVAVLGSVLVVATRGGEVKLSAEGHLGQ
jgi:drug/metabolite transporter (DMT)-like permease